MLKTYHGSCHCGRLRYEADIDLAAGTRRCNCTLCTKTRAWTAIVRPDAFRVLDGEDYLKDYMFGGNGVHHLFCARCGVRAFSRGYVEEVGGHFVSVYLASLDDVTPRELAEAPVTCVDGRDDAWDKPPKETGHL
ncbi:MAG: GFA family protein [Deltaproteobacteria bacterium]|nr:GFA family protein [Deltaproteobacteria bacterium]